MPDEEASYVCSACGEEIVVPVDLTAGEEQEYVEDCPVCCRPHVLLVRVRGDGHVTLRAEPE
jgi:DNA-directed RNA polymerase subunit RPC12/RpoP